MRPIPRHPGFARLLGTRLALIVALIGAAPAMAQSTAPQNEAAHEQFLFAYKLVQQNERELAAEAFDKYLNQYRTAPKRGDAQYFRAMLHRQAGELEAAAELLTSVPDPELVEPHAIKLLRGRVLVDLQRFDEAVTALEAIDAGSLEPTVAASVRYLRGLAYRGAGNLEAAAEGLQRAADTHQSVRAKALLELGRVRSLQDKPADAITALKRAAQFKAVAAEAARLAGDLAYEQARYGDAADFYNRVLGNHQSSKHFGPALVGLLWTHYSAKAHKRVIDTFEQYQQALPAAPRGEARYLVGSAWHALDEPGQAKPHLKAASDALSGDQRAKALYKLAEVQRSLDARDALAQTVERLKRAFPEHALTGEAMMLLAKAEAERGELSAAVDRLSALIDKGENTASYEQAVLNRARFYARAGEPKAAIADYNRYLRAVSRDSEQLRRAMLRLVDLYYHTQQYESAIDMANQLRAKSDLSASLEKQLLYRQGLAWIKLNELEKALNALTRLQNEHPLNPFKAQATYYRGLLLTSLDRGEAAAVVLEAAANAKSLTTDQRGNALRLLAIHQRATDQPEAAAGTLERLRSLVGASGVPAKQLLWLGRYRLEEAGDAQASIEALGPLLGSSTGLEPAQRAEATYLAGKAYRRLDQPDKAIEQLRAVIERAEGFTLEAKLELARALADQGRPRDAIDRLETLIDKTREARIVAHAHYQAATLYRTLAQQREREQNADGARQARKEARRHLKRLIVLYGQFDQLKSLTRQARLHLIALAAERSDEPAQQRQFEILAEGDGPAARYARAMLLAVKENRPGQALAELRTLRDGTRGELDELLRRTLDRSIDTLEGKR